jgi:hypothetical protein
MLKAFRRVGQGMERNFTVMTTGCELRCRDRTVLDMFIEPMKCSAVWAYNVHLSKREVIDGLDVFTLGSRLWWKMSDMGGRYDVVCLASSSLSLAMFPLTELSFRKCDFAE